jgi:hypothetical protein
MLGSAPSDDRFDAAAPQLVQVTVVVVAPVGDDLVGPLTQLPDLACNGHHAVDERQPSDVIAVPARQCDRQCYPGGAHQ